VNQPQFELPQISLARYVDLLRRRRWQVVPMSLIGLVVGAVVAFFVPRYYVVDTLIEYHRPPTDLGPKSAGAREDPFGPIVQNARYKLPQQAGTVMKALGWDEANETDEFQLRENTKAVEQRIEVVDITGKNQDYAQMQVKYRDRDGHRAADFLNGVLEEWKQSQIKALTQVAHAMKSDANQRVAAANATYETINKKLQLMTQRYGFNPMSPEAQREEAREEEKELHDNVQKEAELIADLAKLDTEIERLSRERDVMPPFADPTTDLTAHFSPTSPEGKQYVVLKGLQDSLENVVGPAHPHRAFFEKEIEMLQQKLFGKTVDSGSVRNPQIALWQKKIDDDQADKVVKQARLAFYTQQIHDAKQRRADQASHATEWMQSNNDLALATKQQESAQAALQAADAVSSALTIDPPITFSRVAVPSRPTDPNPLLVAALGCVVGLAVAIGLILLLDVVQSSFKTVDDVERTLPVPVLGGISYFETEEQRRRARSSRLRASLIAASFLGSAVIVVTVYYVAPLHLPKTVLDLLSLVLGNNK
jgi:uncharacterized protein involved in exopolysaccharide biosynthesis